MQNLQDIVTSVMLRTEGKFSEYSIYEEVVKELEEYDMSEVIKCIEDTISTFQYSGVITCNKGNEYEIKLF